MSKNIKNGAASISKVVKQKKITYADVCTKIYADTQIPAKNMDIKKCINPIKYCSLFANVGIGETFLERNGFISAVASELVKNRTQWYKELHPDCSVVQGDFTEKSNFDKLVKLYKEKQCSMVFCSPSCQTVSLAGKRDLTDPRTALFIPMLEFFRQTQPLYIVIENVMQYLTALPTHLPILKGQTIGQYIISELKKMDYEVNVDILDAANYDVCQSRKRMIILASKTGMWKFPVKSPTIPILSDCIGDLPSISAGMSSGIKWHDAPYLSPFQVAVMEHTPTGMSAHNNSKPWLPCNVDGSPSKAKFPSSFQRKAWNIPCNTIVMNSSSISSFRSIHPGRPLPDGTWSDARCLTILELMRVTSLPDDYAIPTWASNKLIRDVIGEAVCPRFMEHLITTIPLVNPIIWKK